MRTYKILIIILFLLLVNLNFSYNLVGETNNSEYANCQYNDEEKTYQQIIEKGNERNQIKNPLENDQGPKPLSNNDIHGGDHLDSFKDESNIESKTNLFLDNNSYTLHNISTKIVDNFEGTDGTSLDVYNSSYSIVSTASGGNYEAEIDTGQYHKGSSSAIMSINQWAKNLWVNLSLNYNQSIIELTCYIRIYTWGTSHPVRVGCSYNFLLFSGPNIITRITFYNGDIRYSDAGNFLNSGKSVTHNKWYKLHMILYKTYDKYTNYEFSVWDTNNLQTPLVTKTDIKVNSAGYSTIDKLSLTTKTVWDSDLNCWLDKLNISTINYQFPGYLQSKPINLPANMHWDTLIINKTQPANDYLNVTIFNATNNQPIPGVPQFITYGEFDISSVSSKLYPSIKLNATFEGYGHTTPKLHYWGVCWNSSNAWCDSLFGGLKVKSYDNVEIIDGEVKFLNSGRLKSRTIDIPDKHYFNTLLINKTEPVGASLKVTVLDAATDTPLSGYKDLTGQIIDLSGINTHDFPSIRLRANYISGGQKGKLFDWSVNWTENTPPWFQDIQSFQTIKRTQTATISVNLSDFEDIEEVLVLNTEYKSPTDTNWKTYYIGTPTYANGRWEIDFTPTVDAVLGIYEFRFICLDSFLYTATYPEPFYIKVQNNDPTFLNINTFYTKVNRTKNLDIFISIFDVETQENSLTLAVKYKSPKDTSWQTLFFSNPIYQNDRWETVFSPSKSAVLGQYILNFSCNDSVSEVYEYLDITVINNRPIQPTIAIIPTEPKTTDDLAVLVSKSKDVETTMPNLEQWCFWYKDDIYMPEVDNQTTISSTYTTKGDVWKCEMLIFDGDDLSTPGIIEVTILNSPPQLVEQFDHYEMLEDSQAILDNKLHKIFSDPDDDTMTYSAIGQVHTLIEIDQGNGTIMFTPSKNWFGTESITLTATDQDQEIAEETMILTVNPTNDLPKITQIGTQHIIDTSAKYEFVVKQNEWLNLSINVKDIDGDVERGMIQYILNITEKTNLYMQNQKHMFVFYPENTDVGVVYLTISMTDNNETPPIYITQELKIRVLNANDPPTVRITKPNDGRVFKDVKSISLSCVADDLDFYVPEPSESLRYRWLTNWTEYSVLGNEKDLILINETMLKPGFYNITVEVTDQSGWVVTDSVHIEVEKSQSGKAAGSTFGTYLFISFIIIVIIILALIFMFVTSQRKKREAEAISAAGIAMPAQELLHPAESYRPGIGLPAGIPGTAASGLGISSTTARVTPIPAQAALGPQAAGTATTPTPQLPPVQPTPSPVPTPIPVPRPMPTPIPSPQPQPQAQAVPTAQPQVDEVRYGIDTGLSPHEKIKLLEERLLRGEIDQDVYLNLKAKYDFEAKPYEPAPRLPPAEAQVPVQPQTIGPEGEVPSTPLPEPIQAPTIPEPITPESQETISPAEFVPSDQTMPEAETPPTTEIPPSETEPEPPLPSELPPDAYQPPQPEAEATQPTTQPVPRPQPEQQPPQQPTPQPPPTPRPRPKTETEEEQ
jgi:uncharacterized membrane protein